MKRRYGGFLIGLLFAAAAAGCAAVVVGAGAGAGAYTYLQGELLRTYPVPYERVLAECVRLLEDLGMPIDSRVSRGEQTTFEARRRDGTPVTIRLRIVGLEATEVAVRTGTVGYWNRDLSEQFHEFLARRL
ncbi:MAG: DUF3568 family protein [Desulfobacterales bacterium]